MRILIAIGSLGGGGAERVAVNLARYWSSLGLEVRIVTLAAAAEDRYAVPAGVSRVALDLAHGGGSFPARAVANLRAIAAYRREIREFDPDITLGMISAMNVIVALAALGHRCAAVGSERTSPANDPLPRIWKLLRYFSYGLLDLVTAQTTAAAAWIRANTLARRTAVIPNAVNLPLPAGLIRVEPDSVCPPDAEILLGVGRLAAVKRFDLLIEAFGEAAASRPDWRLAIIGEGPERAHLESLVARRGLEGRVLLPGRVDNVAAWYARASITALTSTHEGFPNALLEALAHGVPVVSVDCPDGPRDIVRHGVDGLLVPQGDSAAFATELARLMDDKALSARMAAAASEASVRFAEPVVMQRWEDALALASRRSERRSRPPLFRPTLEHQKSRP
jgi:glycosyltransferase involved in cell wall biosynthesis